MSSARIKISSRLLKKKVRKQGFLNPKLCRFCGSKDAELHLDYKNVPLLTGFLTERSKILPSRVSGNCCFHQRQLANEIKRARTMALIPFCSTR